MFVQFCRSVGVTAAVAAFAMSVVAGAQTASSPPPSAVVAAWHAEFSKGWNPPKTPWGDPDLQGNFTWVDEVGTPMERPTEFEGRSLTSITQAQLDAVHVQIQEKHVESVDAPALGVGPPNHWYDHGYELARNAHPWSVLEPADGKIPPLTTEAARLAKTTPKPPSSFIDDALHKGQRPDTWLDWDLQDRCISGGKGPEVLRAGFRERCVPCAIPRLHHVRG